MPDLTSHTQIQIRFGMILEACVAEALKRAGFSYSQAYQYDPVCETPDFLIPDHVAPTLMVETQHLGARNSLMMKTLRLFTAVVEAKSHFGKNLATANIILGRTQEKFAASATTAAGALFDCAILLRKVLKRPDVLDVIEARASQLARSGQFSVKEASTTLLKEMNSEIEVIGKALAKELTPILPTPTLDRLWTHETERRRRLSPRVPVVAASYLKRTLLQSLYLDDAAFAEVLDSNNGSELSPPVVEQIVACGVGTLSEEIDGDHLQFEQHFGAFIKGADAKRLRAIVRAGLAKSEQMHWYFEDIRDRTRREQMARSFLDSLKGGRLKFRDDLVSNVLSKQDKRITHCRSWYVDLISVFSGLGFNHFNNIIYSDKRYPLSLWSPFNNLALKWSSHESDPEYVNCVANILSEAVFDTIKSPIVVSKAAVAELERALLKHRVRSSIKLRNLNPLELIAAGVCKTLDLYIKRESFETLLSDVAADSGVGKVSIYVIGDVKSGKTILFNAVAAYENPKDKAKEWSARRIASLYRLEDGVVVKSPWSLGLFFVDGVWEPRDIERLYRSGWNYVVGWQDLESTLRNVFHR
jgi:hypothetical protein